MSKPLILDTSALLAIVKGETGSDAALSIIDGSAGNIYIHAVNAFEVAYKLMLWGFPENVAWDFPDTSSAQKIDDAGGPVSRCAARLKIASPHLSLGDCFCLGLAEDMKGSVLTSDNGFSKVKTTAEIIMFR